MRSFLPFLSIILALDGIAGIVINQCCPPGQIFSQLGEEEEAGCAPFDGELPPILTQWTSGQEKAIEFRTWNGTRFQCNSAQNRGLAPVGLIYGPDVDVYINDDTGYFLIEANGTEVDSYSNDMFCAYYTDLYSEAGEITHSFSVCYEEQYDEEIEERSFNSVFYPTAILVSAFFILITLTFYLTVEDLRKSLFSKITLGFLLNVFLCYLLLGISYTFNFYFFDAYRVGAGAWDSYGIQSCKIMGYIIHHTFIAFFFWMSAMAFNIAKSLSALKIVRNQNSSLKNLLVYCLYAQGIPALISIFIILMDTIKPSNALLPNVGEFNCFVGSEFDPEKSFFEKSEFIYFYLIVIVMITFNFICFLVTAINLYRHWHNMQGIQNSCADGFVEHSTVILKLSIIMGVPWILDVISASLDQESDLFPLRVALDVVNLFTGILIFLTLICKVSVLKQIKESYSGGKERRKLSQANSTMNSSAVSGSFKKDSIGPVSTEGPARNV